MQLQYIDIVQVDKLFLSFYDKCTSRFSLCLPWTKTVRGHTSPCGLAKAQRARLNHIPKETCLTAYDVKKQREFS